MYGIVKERYGKDIWEGKKELYVCCVFWKDLEEENEEKNRHVSAYRSTSGVPRGQFCGDHRKNNTFNQC